MSYSSFDIILNYSENLSGPCVFACQHHPCVWSLTSCDDVIFSTQGSALLCKSLCLYHDSPFTAGICPWLEEPRTSFSRELLSVPGTHSPSGIATSWALFSVGYLHSALVCLCLTVCIFLCLCLTVFAPAPSKVKGFYLAGFEDSRDIYSQFWTRAVRVAVAVVVHTFRENKDGQPCVPPTSTTFETGSAKLISWALQNFLDLNCLYYRFYS